MTEEYQDEYHVRLKKLQELKKRGIQIYPDRFNKTHLASEALKLNTGTTAVSLAGRIVAKREMGKICFCQILDDSGKIQLVLQRDVLEKQYDLFLQLIDLGDFIGVEGDIFKTQKGEKSLRVKKYTFLGKSLRPLPEKWHGLKDRELQYRRRYLDLISNRETKDRFSFRSRFIRLLREFYWSHNFVEIETPILAATASGALAKPFVTHHNAMDIDVYLRISVGETWQKMVIVGGFEKTFEIGKVFRNEGIDPSHLQEYTSVEHYAAYWNYEDNIQFTEKMFVFLLKELFGTLKIPIKNQTKEIQEVDFTPPWPRKTYREIIQEDCGIDIFQFDTTEGLLREIQKKNLFDEEMQRMGKGNLIDALFKKVSRPKILSPTIILQHPVELSPLARRNDNNPAVVDRFQLIIRGWEVVNAYSELVDPVDQKERFREQAKAKSQGDINAHGEDDEFIRALEYGSPPISGWGMGIDRMVALLTQQNNLRDVVLFPLLKP